LLAVGLGLALGGAAFLRDELRSPNPGEDWIIGFCVVIAIGVGCLGATVLEYVRHRGMSDEVPNPCGDPEVRRNRIRDHAKHLSWELEHFDCWWPAIEDRSFDGKLPGAAMRTTHAEAMSIPRSFTT